MPRKTGPKLWPMQKKTGMTRLRERPAWEQFRAANGRAGAPPGGPLHASRTYASCILLAGRRDTVAGEDFHEKRPERCRLSYAVLGLMASPAETAIVAASSHCAVVTPDARLWTGRYNFYG